MNMKRKYNPPASPRDAEREGDVPRFESVEELDGFFTCRHHVDLSYGRCADCREEAAERRAEMEDEIRDELFTNKGDERES